MPLTFYRWTRAAVLLTLLGSAGAAPALPASSLAEQAVRDALAPQAPAAVPVPPAAQAAVQRSVASASAAAPGGARPAPTASAQSQANLAAQARAQTLQRVPSQPVLARSVSRTGRSAVVRATAYNSMPGQTDSTPFITATGTRVRPGVVALSRDMLRLFPYGTRITIEDLSGRYNSLLRGRVFVVEDTMAARKTGSIDIWMPTLNQALQFGARQVRITAIR
ncbi:3D domain-containing protein [Deinococcus sp. S9]|uniref:3D domain-containing protein n=1 Tax=Deinococcus sp. S9 TaxID=2545754 RepID=UPI001054DB92|nr:3D domain-containing protein [Deinococcus sp. S9]TDE87568.1 hypothetical protein E0686_00660 [Deinococcus sp. S9]